ncbi:MAG: ISAs1 family transposase [Synechococcaceae cyanobacterium]|nr:ISAs1 family transposase [Synechococcaceae cyanobacterium]
MTVKRNQPELYRRIDELFTYTRHFPVNAQRSETGHGRTTTWTLRSREATDVIRQDWPGVSWVIELVVTGTRKGRAYRHVHYFITSLRTSANALLRLVRQRWSIENQWHWARDTQLREDAHRYADRVGMPLLSFLRTIAMNLLRMSGFRSIRAGLQRVAHDITGMLTLGGISPAQNS